MASQGTGTVVDTGGTYAAESYTANYSSTHFGTAVHIVGICEPEEPSPVEQSSLYRWDGYGWDQCVFKEWTGSSWKIAETKVYWNGSWLQVHPSEV